jgi:hypothetical protein
VTAREQDVRAFAKDMLCSIELTGDTVAGLPFCRVRQLTGYDDEAQDFQRVVSKHELPGNYPHPWPKPIPVPAAEENRSAGISANC